MFKKFYLSTLLLITIIAPLSAHIHPKQYCTADQILVYGDRIWIKEGNEINEVDALFSDEEGIYYMHTNQCPDDCRRSRGLPPNPYRNICNKPNCPHDKS